MTRSFDASGPSSKPSDDFRTTHLGGSIVSTPMGLASRRLSYCVVEFRRYHDFGQKIVKIFTSPPDCPKDWLIVQMFQSSSGDISQSGLSLHQMEQWITLAQSALDEDSKSVSTPGNWVMPDNTLNPDFKDLKDILKAASEGSKGGHNERLIPLVGGDLSAAELLEGDPGLVSDEQMELFPSFD